MKPMTDDNGSLRMMTSNLSLEDEHMWRLANLFARSGVYRGWREIRRELSARGYSRARDLFAEANVRERLNLECSEARGRLNGAGTGTH